MMFDDAKLRGHLSWLGPTMIIVPKDLFKTETLITPNKWKGERSVAPNIIKYFFYNKLLRFLINITHNYPCSVVVKNRIETDQKDHYVLVIILKHFLPITTGLEHILSSVKTLLINLTYIAKICYILE